MTENEWLTTEDPFSMARWVGLRASARKARLFEAACCRRLLASAPAEWLAEIVKVAEEYAEGETYGPALSRVRGPAGGNAWVAAKALARRIARDQEDNTERLARCALLRDVFGNPFRPTPFEPSWRTPAVTHLAQTAYLERDAPFGTLGPENLAVLADALEEAGCTTPEILEHCRAPSGVHIRGCWVLDLILGRK